MMMIVPLTRESEHVKGRVILGFGVLFVSVVRRYGALSLVSPLVRANRSIENGTSIKSAKMLSMPISKKDSKLLPSFYRVFFFSEGEATSNVRKNEQKAKAITNE